MGKRFGPPSKDDPALDYGAKQLDPKKTYQPEAKPTADPLAGNPVSKRRRRPNRANLLQRHDYSKDKAGIH